MSAVKVFYKTKFGKVLFYILQLIGVVYASMFSTEYGLGYFGWISIQILVFIIVYFISHIIDLVLYRLINTNLINIMSITKNIVNNFIAPYSNSNEKVILSIPKWMFGIWKNEHYDIIAFKESIEIIENSNKKFLLPKNIKQNTLSNKYIISYIDPFILTNVSIEFIRNNNSMIFMVARDNMSIEIRETLEKINI